MTEQEWNTTASIDDLRYFVFRNGAERKLRLFSCACCRRVWEQLSDERSKQAVTVAEKFADGLATDAELESVALAAEAVWTELDEGNVYPRPISAAAYNVAIPMGWWGGAPAFQAPERIIREAAADFNSECEAQRHLIRDIFGNPFRPVAFDPSWRTTTAVAIAKGMYDSRDFSAMPILADALQDAGCEHADILDHCRSPGPHVKGCWVVDLVLGKE